MTQESEVLRCRCQLQKALWVPGSSCHHTSGTSVSHQVRQESPKRYFDDRGVLAGSDTGGIALGDGASPPRQGLSSDSSRLEVGSATARQ